MCTQNHASVLICCFSLSFFFEGVSTRGCACHCWITALDHDHCPDAACLILQSFVFSRCNALLTFFPFPWSLWKPCLVCVFGPQKASNVRWGHPEQRVQGPCCHRLDCRSYHARKPRSELVTQKAGQPVQGSASAFRAKDLEAHDGFASSRVRNGSPHGSLAGAIGRECTAGLH